MKIENEKDKLALKLIGGMVLAVVVVFVVSLILSDEKVDPVTFCKSHIERKSIFIFDRTSKINVAQKKDIRTKVEKIINENLEEGEAIYFFEISSKTYSGIEPISFDGSRFFCKPKQHVSKIIGGVKNELFENEKSISSKFNLVLEAVLSQDVLNRDNEDSDSPIAETIYSISRMTEVNDAKEVSYYIFSDFMQNSNSISMYTSSDPEAFKRSYINSLRGKVNDINSAQPQFRNIKFFQYFGIPLKSGESDVFIKAFWHNWFFSNINFLKNTPNSKYGCIERDNGSNIKVSGKLCPITMLPN